ncbi:MAG: phage portal protein [Acutalibacter sp.]|nr:phage portal protein [Acutalibacter sp.]
MAKFSFRGLFQSIFGTRPPGGAGNAPAFRLLSTWDSGFTPFSGNAWDISTVRAAVDAFARNAAKIQPRHIKRTGGKRLEVHDEVNRILQKQPNPHMTAYALWYKVAAQFVVYNNAFLLPVFDVTGKLEAIYPINASRVELVEYAGEMYARLTFATGSIYHCPYSQLIHLRRHYLDNDIFGDDNRPLTPTLETASAFNHSMSKFAQMVSVIRGILKAGTVTKSEDLNKRRDDFVKDNLRMENNGSGVIVVDAKYDYTPINEKSTPLPTGQLEFVRREIYDYFGVNEEIVQNKADADKMDAFYRGELAPFYMQLAQGLENAIFTERERGHGNEIICELDRIQFETIEKRVSAAQFLTNISALSLDQVLEIFGFPPIGGEEGARRVQSLNMVNALIADKYQLTSAGNKGAGKEDSDPPADGSKKDGESGEGDTEKEEES